jgi:hypothetical protein
MWPISFNVVLSATNIVAWILIGVITLHYYKKSIHRIKLWRAIIVVFVGLFTFSINWELFSTMIKIPLLPLGVWIAYGVLKRKEGTWSKYRTFAWIGFCTNFILIIPQLIAVPIHQAVFPETSLTTYISNLDDADIMKFHPSGEAVKLNQVDNLHTFKQEKIKSDTWYNDTVMYIDPNQRRERFPYQLINTTPKWGSGIHTIIYLEEDGKGILITTPSKQLYFRSAETLWKGRDQ